MQPSIGGGDACHMPPDPAPPFGELHPARCCATVLPWCVPALALARDASSGWPQGHCYALVGRLGGAKLSALEVEGASLLNKA